MNETIVNETIEQADQEAVKPYIFRKLSSDDMFLMFTIIKKIGIKEFKNCIEGDSVERLVKSFKKSKAANNAENAEKETADNAESALIAVGLAVGVDALDVILGNLPKCKEEMYELLANVSGMKVKDIRADALLFMEMVIDFFKKPEFPAFYKVVSKLFR